MLAGGRAGRLKGHSVVKIPYENAFLVAYSEAVQPETLPETTESGPLCITDLFQNKSVAYF